MKKSRFNFLTLILVGVLSACSTESTTQPPAKILTEPVEAESRLQKQVQIQDIECWFDYDNSINVSCFDLFVPQDYLDPQGLWISFPIVKAKAKNPEPEKSPVLHLGGGGPGNPIGFWANADANWLFDRYAPMSIDNGRDLYIIDPRGVGNAYPALECSEYVDMIEQVLGEDVDSERESQLSAQAYIDCRERLQQEGIDLSQYHSANVARDINQLALILNVEKWNLYGASYGTRYAQTIARDFPGITESMILDAATFMDIKYIERTGKDFMQTFERLFQYCDNERSCKQALGDVRDTFWNLISQLNEQPVLFEIDHPNQAGKIEIMLNGTRFLNAYYNALYDASNYADLPAVMESIRNKKLGKFKVPLSDWVSYVTDRFYGDGAAISHYCWEEAPFVDYKKALQSLELLPLSIQQDAKIGLQYSQIQCDQWIDETASDIEGRALYTEIPTLFLHGALDPVLPVEDIDLKSQTFLNSDTVVFDEISHTVIGSQSCGDDIARAFYEYKNGFRSMVNCL